MGCIPKELCREINEKMDYLKRNNTFGLSMLRDRRARRVIERTSHQESHHIEYPYEVPTKNNKEKRRKNIEKIKHIKEAFVWGRNNFNPNSFEEPFIKKLAHIIIPEIFNGKETGEYRYMSSHMLNEDFVYPSHDKLIMREIPQFISKLNRDLKKDDSLNFLKTALYSHFTIFRVHPFYDGNGRIARTFQNIILDYAGFPLPVLTSGERRTYFDILKKARMGYNYNQATDKRGVSQEEKDFYTFMAGKVNSSLDKVLNCRY